MKIKILKQYVEDAKAHAFERSHYYGNPKYPQKMVTHFYRFDNIIRGKTGEEAVKAVFRVEKIPHEVCITEIGEPDQFDIRVGKMTIDVKTITKDSIRALMVSKEPFDFGRQMDYYILVELEEGREIAEVHGYATKEDFKKAGVTQSGKRLVYAIPIEKLRPIEELLETLRRAAR